MSTEKVLTEMQQKFVDALFSDETKGNPKLAKSIAGYSDSVSVGNIIGPLQDVLLDRAKQMLAMYSAKALLSYDDVLTNPAEMGAMTKVKAAKDILTLAGFGKEETGIKAPEGGVIILPAKNAQITVTTNLD